VNSVLITAMDKTVADIGKTSQADWKSSIMVAGEQYAAICSANPTVMLHADK